MTNTHIVLLSGGSGSRLWPLSSGVRSKQFLKVLRDAQGNHVSMVQRTYAKVRALVPGCDVTIATCAEQAAMLAEQVQGDYALVVEPERRDTAPAIMLACAHLRWSQHAGLDDPVVVLPIASYVEDGYYAGLSRAVDAVRAGAAELVLLGMEPTYPSEKYGYIVPSGGAPLAAGAVPVGRFVEKPAEAEAARLVAAGTLWNCGVFAFRLGHVVDILAGYGDFRGYADLRSRYGELPRRSFDYEVVERAASVAAVPYAGAWKDLGTWNTLTEEMADAASGRVVLDASPGTHVVSELGLPVVVSGIPDAVVVATESGILVCAKGRSAGIKPLVARACSPVSPDWELWRQHADEGEASELEALAADPAALAGAFSRELAFGTGGIRERMGQGPALLNRRTVGRATQGLAGWLVEGGHAGGRVALARDTRERGAEFVAEAASVLAANGLVPLVFEDPAPTPALSFAVRELGCVAGVVITASHNPREYNGYKVYGADGCQATTRMCREIQARIRAVDAFEGVRHAGVGFGPGAIDANVITRYVDAAVAAAPGPDCSGLRVAYTPLCGTGLGPVRGALAQIGVSEGAGNLFVAVEQASTDGSFAACPRPNPEEPEAMAAVIALAEANGCDLALANDPDADRLGVAVPDGRGGWRRLTGDEMGLLLLERAARRAEADGRGMRRMVALTTVVSAPAADDLARAHGLELRRTLTGFKFIGEQLGLLEAEGREGDFLLGVEESLGYLAGGYVRDKDGVGAAVLACRLAAELKAEGSSVPEALDELADTYGHWAQRQLTFPFPGAGGADAMAGVMSSLRREPPASLGGLVVDGTIDYLPGAPMPVVSPLPGAPAQALPPSDVLEWRLAGGSRVLLRPSGTEPKLKAYVFARSESGTEAQALLERLAIDVHALLTD